MFSVSGGVCGDGDVRLEEKEGEYVGRVGVCRRGQWGSVADEGVSENVGIVVCRQLGLPLDGTY